MTIHDAVVQKILPYTSACENCDRLGDVCLDCTEDAREAARVLDKAHLLAPELPRPVTDTDGSLTWHDGAVWVEADDDHVHTDLPKSANWMTADQARTLAYELLAAANHTEKRN